MSKLTGDDLSSLEGVIRRVVAARVRDRDDVDDLVQETLARLIAHRSRVDGPDGLRAYAIVTAQNLVANTARNSERRRRRLHRLVDLRSQPASDEPLLEAEDQQAIATAITRLAPAERDALVSHVLGGESTKDLAERRGSSAGAAAVHLASVRAKLRLEYVLALRGIDLPTERCRPVLVALSAADRRRQRALDADSHLADCWRCAELSQSLVERRRSLAGIWPVPAIASVLGGGWRVVRSHPAGSAVASVAVAATVASAAVMATSDGDPPRGAAAPSVSSIEAAPAGDRTLVVDDEPVFAGTANTPVRLSPGQATARGVLVESVPADEGFWVGPSATQRVWVQIVGDGESPVRVQPGQRVDFDGSMFPNPAALGESAGLDAEGAAQLERQAHHVQVRAEAIRPH